MGGNKLNKSIDIIKKFISNDVKVDKNFFLKPGLFNSLISDRIRVELSKIDIVWDGVTEISLNNLANNKLDNNNDNLENLLSNQIQQLGIDIQCISELPQANDYWSDEFYIELFTEKEIAYSLSKENPKQTFAGLYAVKEAIFKSNNNENVKSIKLSFENDKPAYRNYLISISHSSDYAVATALYIDNIEATFEAKISESVKKEKKQISGSIESLELKIKNLKFLILSIIILVFTYITYNELF